MPQIFYRISLLCASLLLLTAATLFWNNQLSLLVRNTGIGKDQHELRILRLSSFANASEFKCISAKVANLSFPMCLYNAHEDIYVSGLNLGGGYFESVLVHKYLNITKNCRDVTFVDLGANLGTYSLPFAHSGIGVVSVEANWNTARRLATSSYLGGLGNKINILNYALANNESTATLHIEPTNRGNTFMVGSDSSGTNCKSNCVSVTTLDRIIPLIRTKTVIMKADIQGAEVRVFTESGAGKFFGSVDVRMLLMEWVLYARNYGKQEATRRAIDDFLRFFYRRRYEVFDPISEKKLTANWTLWPYDVLFKKSGLP